MTEHESILIYHAILTEYLESDPSAYLLHTSTDSVFDGQVGNYKEMDPTNPVNWYGKTKLEAEKDNC